MTVGAARVSVGLQRYTGDAHAFTSCEMVQSAAAATPHVSSSMLISSPSPTTSAPTGAKATCRYSGPFRLGSGLVCSTHTGTFSWSSTMAIGGGALSQACESTSETVNRFEGLRESMPSIRLTASFERGQCRP